MDKIVKRIIKLDFEDIFNYDFPTNEFVGLIVNFHDGVKYEFLLNLKEDNHLLVIGSGLRQKNSKIDVNRPVFHRWSWKFKESTIFYNDPTIYIHKDLAGGWGVGTIENYYLKNISIIIEEIAENIKIKNQNMFFYGSSQGGFMSLVLSILIKDSVAIAEVPQFDVSLFTKSHWDNLRKYCFLGLDEYDIRKKYGEKIDIIELIKTENYIPNAYLILDSSSSFELNSSILPFFNRLLELPYSNYQNNIKIRLDGKNKGHSAQIQEDLLDTIEKIISLEDKKNSLRLPNVFEKYITSRIDLKNYGNENNSIEIIEISDSECRVEYPNWFKDDSGEGLKLESINGNMYIKLKCVNGGIFSIKLRSSIDFVKEGKKIPIFINFNKLIINNEILIDKPTIVDFNNFYVFSKEVKNNENIEIQISWVPV